jgi:hypothetical protein
MPRGCLFALHPDPVVMYLPPLKVPPPTFGLTPTNMDLDMAYFLAARGVYGWVGSGPILGWQLSHWWAPGQFTPNVLLEADVCADPLHLHHGVTSCHSERSQHQTSTQAHMKHLPVDIKSNCQPSLPPNLALYCYQPTLHIKGKPC